MTSEPPATHRPRIPRTVWALGVVSLFTDMASELVHALLPVFMVGTLGASALMVGIVDGLAEALALATKVFSGYVSDLVGKRKPLVVLGYGLAALSKPLFPMATSIAWVFGARLFDRLGKGIRGAPRDALIADVTPAQIRGAAYGLRQSMDTVGAVAGPLLAIGLMLWLVGDIRAAMWFAVIPGAIAVLVLLVAVREPERTHERVKPRLPFTREGIAALGGGYWRIVAVGALLMLARATEAFLILRASSLGLSNTWVPLVMVVMAIAYTLVAWPAGHWSDRRDRRVVLALGLLLLIVADLVLAMAPGIPALLLGVALWGVHMGLTQGVFAALIADQAPGALRGTAFGVFNLASGLALLIAAICAGLLFDHVGPGAPFVFGAAVAALCLLLLPWLPGRAAPSTVAS